MSMLSWEARPSRVTVQCCWAIMSFGATATGSSVSVTYTETHWLPTFPTASRTVSVT